MCLLLRREIALGPFGYKCRHDHYIGMVTRTISVSKGLIVSIITMTPTMVTTEVIS